MSYAVIPVFFSGILIHTYINHGGSAPGGIFIYDYTLYEIIQTYSKNHHFTSYCNFIISIFYTL